MFPIIFLDELFLSYIHKLLHMKSFYLDFLGLYIVVYQNVLNESNWWLIMGKDVKHLYQVSKICLNLAHKLYLKKKQP